MKRPQHHHDFVFEATNEHNEAVFRCTHCTRSIGFPFDRATDNGDKTFSILDADHLPGGAIDNTIGKCDA